MNKVNQIVIMRDECNSEEEYRNKIVNTVLLLLSCNYDMVVRTELDEKQQVIFDYDSCEQMEYGNPIPVWLTPEQIEKLGDDADGIQVE